MNKDIKTLLIVSTSSITFLILIGTRTIDVSLGYIFAMYFFYYLGIYIHEFGHALAGSIVKIPIKRIVVGTGRELVRMRFGRAQLIITSTFFNGATYYGEISEKSLPLRFFIFGSGGILAQCFAILVCIFVFGLQANDIFSARFSSIGQAFIHINLLMIFFSILPIKYEISGINTPSDGLRLARIPFWKTPEIKEILMAGKLNEGQELIEAKRYDDAEIELRKCLKQYPAFLAPKINLALILIKQLKWEEARTMLRASLEEYRDDPLLFLAYNNLAWANFFRLDEKGLRKADIYSKKAIELNPKIQCVISTRGCVLIEGGAIDEGMNLLTSIVKPARPLDEHTNHPVSFIYLAYGCHLKGFPEDALSHLRKIEEHPAPLDPDNRFLYDHVIAETKNFNRGEGQG